MFTNSSKLFKNFVFPYMNIIKGKEINSLFHFLKERKKPSIEIVSQQKMQSRNIRLKNDFVNQHLIDITDSLKHEEKIIINIDGRSVFLNIISEENTDLLVESTISILELLYSIHPINKELHLNLFLTNETKMLESHSLPCDIGKNEVNSGSCERGHDKCIVNIWRKEEIIKVIFHELIHAFEYDNINDTHELLTFYKQRYHLSSNKINIHEAYTEIWANILNCFWISQKVNTNQYNNFRKLLSIEKEFAIFQCEKIMYFTNMKHSFIDINKHTNVLAYYIIRCEIFNQLEIFLKICKDHNKNYIYIQNDKYLLSFFFKKSKEIKNLNQKIKLLKTNSYLYKNTRMSGIEYNTFMQPHPS